MAVRSDGTSTQHLATNADGSRPASGPVTLCWWHQYRVNPAATKIFAFYHNNAVDSGGGASDSHGIMISTDDGSNLDIHTILNAVPQQSAIDVWVPTVGNNLFDFWAIVRDGSSVKWYIGTEFTHEVFLAASLTDANLMEQHINWRLTITGNSAVNVSPDAAVAWYRMWGAALTLEELQAERRGGSPNSGIANNFPTRTADLFSFNPLVQSGQYGAVSGSSQTTFTQQGGSGFNTVTGPRQTHRKFTSYPKTRLTGQGRGR